MGALVMEGTEGELMSGNRQTYVHATIIRRQSVPFRQTGVSSFAFVVDLHADAGKLSSHRRRSFCPLTLQPLRVGYELKTAHTVYFWVRLYHISMITLRRILLAGICSSAASLQ
jgi:hypothetical protein